MGRADERLSEATGMGAMTIHHLLEVMTLSVLQCYSVLVIMELCTRRVIIGGIELNRLAYG